MKHSYSQKAHHTLVSEINHCRLSANHKTSTRYLSILTFLRVVKLLCINNIMLAIISCKEELLEKVGNLKTQG